MKYYSELTRTFYDTEEECLKADIMYNDAMLAKQKEQEARQLKIEELEQSLKDVNTGIKELEKQREKICKELNEYGISISSMTSYGITPRLLTEIFRDIFGE